MLKHVLSGEGEGQKVEFSGIICTLGDVKWSPVCCFIKGLD